MFFFNIDTSGMFKTNRLFWLGHVYFDVVNTCWNREILMKSCQSNSWNLFWHQNQLRFNARNWWITLKWGLDSSLKDKQTAICHLFLVFILSYSLQGGHKICNYKQGGLKIASFRAWLGMGVQTRAARRAQALTDAQTRVLKQSSIQAGHT